MALNVEATVDPEMFASAAEDSLIIDRIAGFFQRALRRDATERFPDIDAMKSAWQAILTPSEDERLEHLKRIERLRRDELLAESDSGILSSRPAPTLAQMIAFAVVVVAVVVILLIALGWG